MRILIYSDNHFCMNSSILRKKGVNYSIRLENQVESINWAEKVADDENVDLIVHCGDFFDRPDLNAEEISALKDITWSNKKHIFLVGNHEMASSDLHLNSVNVLSKIGQIIDKPMIDSAYGCELIYLPYILESERKSFTNYINNLRKDYWSEMWTTQEVKKVIVFSHNDICGIRYGQYESKIGFNIEEIENNCDLFINGHLHNQTQINKKILNIGNLTGQNFSEDAFKYSHCLGILDTDTLKIDLINNPYAINFYKIDFTENFNEKALIDTFSQVHRGVISVKVYQRDVKEIKDYIENCNDVIEYKITIVPENIKNSEETKNLSALDHIEQFKKYILEHLGTSDIVKSELNNIT